VKELKWKAPAKLAGPISLEVVNDTTLQLELPPTSSRVNASGAPVGGAYVQLGLEDVDELISDLQEARKELDAS
jgi:hypothetical protein